MASDDLKKDGYLNVDVAARNIVYHPHLNVILIFTKTGDVKVLDVNSGVILQSCHLSDASSPLNGKYVAKQDKILMWDAKSLGYRGDYNGVLLLDTILQRPIACSDQVVSLELLVSEAILFLQTLRNLMDAGVPVCSDVVQLLTEKIQEAQANSKKGIKAQKWNIVCIEFKYSDFKLVALNAMVQSKKMERHIPGLAIASAINERLTDLMRSARLMDSLATPDFNDRYLMITEAARRETFVSWPHVDYNWALPDQMAQAGFYYNPNETGDDRAMCFTCNVCLVSWEKADEPWSEHERHSPICPFVKGEYTENVPLSVTFSTCPAVESATPFNIVSNGEDGVIICTAETPGTVFQVWSIERLLSPRFAYNVANEERMLKLYSHCFNGNRSNTVDEIITVGDEAEGAVHSKGGAVTGPTTTQPLSTDVTALATFAFGAKKNQPVPKQNAAWNAENLIQTRICCAVSARVASDSMEDGDQVTNNVSEAFLLVYKIQVQDEKKKSKSALSSLSDVLKTMSPTASDSNISADGKDEDTKMDIVELNLEDLKKKYNIKNEDRVRDCLMSMIRITQTDNGTATTTPSAQDLLNSATALPPPPPLTATMTTSSTTTSNSSLSGSNNSKNLTKSKKITLNGITEEEENDLVPLFPAYDSALLKSNSNSMSTEDVEEALKQTEKDLIYLTNEMGINLDVSMSPTTMMGSNSSSKMSSLLGDSGTTGGTLKGTSNTNKMNFTCLPLQCISLASIAPDSYVISDVIPSHDQSYLLVVLKRDPAITKVRKVATATTRAEEVPSVDETMEEATQPATSEDCAIEATTQLVLFRVTDSGLLEKQPHCVQLLFEDSAPLSICMLPGYETERKTAETKDGVFAMVCVDGSLKLMSLSTLRTISDASIDGEKFIAATYCKSLDRICGCTENGSLHFYSFYENDMESGDEHEDHNIPMGSDESLDEDDHEGFGREDATDARMKEGGVKRPPLLPNENVANFVAYKQDLTQSDLKQAYQLTEFYGLLFPYTGEVPVCWNELVVQKVRRHSPMLKPGEDVHLSKTWRLHRDATTWDEHLIELTLPLSVSLGHIDFKFKFYQPCEDPPKIQVTLLKQFSSGFGYRMKTPTSNENRAFSNSPAPGMSSVDENIDFNLNTDEMKANIENPVLSVEYLHNHNAEILAGPIELSSCMDLTEQNGTVILTSPKLFRTRGRNYLIHIKTMTDPTKDDSHGCDWLHEISINVRRVAPITNNKIADDRAQRCAILENNGFLNNLFRIACQPETVTMQNLALDLIHWIVSIRMTRFRSPKTSENTFPDVHALQKECVKILNGYLSQFVLVCFLGGNRSVAHKCTKILLVMYEGVGNMRTKGVDSTSATVTQCETIISTFHDNLKAAILACLDQIKDVRYAGSLRWLNVLICGTSHAKTYPEVASKLLELLSTTSTELGSRYNPYVSLLRARFGLYGLPFEMERFDIMMPRPNNKLVAHPGTLANIVKTAKTGGVPTTEGKPSTSTTDALELKYLPMKLPRRAVGHQMKGLLEVMILHYVCVDASEATRLENMESSGQFVGRSTHVDDITFDQQMSNGNATQAEVSQFKTQAGGSLSKSAIDLLTATKDVFYNAVNYLKEHGQEHQFGLSDEESSQSDCEQMITMAAQQENMDMASAIGQADDAAPAMPSNVILPWHKLLSLSEAQVMVIERMHPGAKRHVTLDFGMPIMLTDILIPACEDLISIIVDIWCIDEEVDSCRLTTCSDIGTKPLIISDLQPAPVCRYLKVSVMGKYGMSGTRCKVPIGLFYGHQIVVDVDCYDAPVYKIMKRKGLNHLGMINVNDQLGPLHSFFEDVHCRYNLACGKLMDQLDPLLKSDASNLAHLQTHFGRTKDTDDTVADHAKIVASYEECINLQNQLNVTRNVIKRLEESQRSPGVAGLEKVDTKPLNEISTDKLRVLNEVFIETLLYFIVEHDLKAPVSEMTNLLTQEKCSELFNSIIISMDIHIQLATCTMLVKMCGLQSWWGEFLANVLTNMFSSENTKIFPHDRVFLLLTYMGRKSISLGANRSLVIDHVLKSLAMHLMPLSQQSLDRYLWAKTDLQHISWLLLFLSVCLDDGNAPGGDRKEYQSSRWEFMTGESDLVKNRNQTSNSKQMLCRSFKKRMMNNKYNPPSSNEKLYMMQTAESTPVTNLSSQFEMAIKQELAPKDGALKKTSQSSMKPFLDCIVDLSAKQKLKIYKSAYGSNPISSLPSSKPRYGASSSSGSGGLGGIGNGSKSSAFAKQSPPDGPEAGPKRPLVLKPQNTILVVRALVQLLLAIGPACNMDLFLLTCKVIAQLVSTCSSNIRMSMIMNETELGELIRMAIWRERHQPWVVLALTSLFQDIIEADKNYKIRDESSDVSPSGSGMSSTPSSGSASTSSSSVSVNKSDSLLMIPDIMDDSTKETKTMIINNIMSMLDNRKPSEHRELKRDFIKAKGIFPSRNDGNVICRNISNAIDSRLEYGLDTNVEMRTKRLSLLTYLNLFTNLSSPHQVIIDNQFDADSGFGKDGLRDWPEHIVKAWSSDSYVFRTNESARHMLIYVFSTMFEMLLYQEQPWWNLEQTLHLYLVLNGQYVDKAAGAATMGAGTSASAAPGNVLATSWESCIPLTRNAINGLLFSMRCIGNIRIRTWCLAFQTLISQCEVVYMDNESGPSTSDSNKFQSRGSIAPSILNSCFPVLEMFFSGDGITTTDVDVKQCVGPTVCKLVQKFFKVLNFQDQPDYENDARVKYMDVLLALTNYNGAISKKSGPIDVQNELIKELMSYDYTMFDLRQETILKLIQNIARLVYNHVNKKDWIYCQKSADTKNYSIFNSIYTTVFGSDSESTSVSHDLLLMNLLKLIHKIVSAAQGEEGAMIARSLVEDKESMNLLLNALMNCNRSCFALLLACDTTKGDFKWPFGEHMTVSGTFFQFMMLIRKKVSQPAELIKPSLEFLRNRMSFNLSSFSSYISESFLWYMLYTLTTPEAVLEFTKLEGIEVLCKNIVDGQRYILNMQPGMISMIMQFLTKSPISNGTSANGSSSSGTKKPPPPIPTAACSSHLSMGLKGSDGLINFAPFCSISSETSTVQQTDVLIQVPIASHRRARTAAWNYMFYQNQSYVDLTITFPTAVLVKEVQLLPHLPSLASCPYAVAVELTRDSGLPPIPMSQPMSTVGLTCIKLIFAEAEIATSMVLRLYRPRDSSTIGLTQISIFGTTTFSDVNKMNAFVEQQNEEENLMKWNLAWLKILEVCFMVSSENSEVDVPAAVIKAASDYPQFLETCCSMLNTAQSSPATLPYIETILLKMGLYSRDLGLNLIENLLKDSIPQSFKLYNDTLSDLLYDLCTHQDDFTRDRIQAVIKWAEKLYEEETEENLLLRATHRYCGFVKCIASILWTAHTTGLVTNLEGLITESLFESIYRWTVVLSGNDPFRQAIDSILCSICAIRPELFQLFLRKIGVTAPETNMSDDRKATMGRDEKMENDDLPPMEEILNRDQLLSLAMACQSRLAVQQLIDSGLPNTLANYCGNVFKLPKANREDDAMQMEVDDEVMLENIPELCQMENEPKTQILAKDIENCRNIIDFFSEVCSEGLMRDWLGSAQGSCFWKPLLYRLCHARLLNDRHEIETQFTELEKVTIRFLSKVTTCHPKNQDLVMRILIDVIRQPESVIGDCNLGSRQSISGFTRRLILDLLLENEKILVAVHSQVQLSKKDVAMNLSNHPSKRPNAHNVFMLLSTDAKAIDILDNCVPFYSNFFNQSGSETSAGEASGSSMDDPGKSERKFSTCENILGELTDATLANGPGDGGIGVGGGVEESKGNGYWKSFTSSLMEMYQAPELLSVAAGVTAKDKRLKDVKNHAAVLRSKETLSSMRADDPQSGFRTGGMGVNLVHSLCPNAVITSDTTIAQVLAMLGANGHSLSTPCLQLDLVQTPSATTSTATEGSSETMESSSSGDDRKQIKACDFEPIACPLQIFASHGGLSLLALPTVYPDTQKSAAASMGVNLQDRDKSPGMNEWVKIEPSYDFYEDLDDTTSDQNSKTPVATTVPMYSLSAFGLFLKLPPYSDVLLKDKLRAQFLLRLVLGVTGDGDGNEICCSPVAASLPTLPFEVFRQLLDCSMLITDDGMKLRHMVIEVGAIQLVLRCLSIFTHQSGKCHNEDMELLAQRSKATQSKDSFGNTAAPAGNAASSSSNIPNGGIGGLSSHLANNVVDDSLTADEKSNMYWAKGTGFGTGSTQQSWDVEQSIMKQKSEEEQVTVLLQILSSYLNPGDQRDTFVDLSGDLPPIFYDLMQASCLIPVLCSYLRNDSVLDITRHIPLYRAILLLLRAVAQSSKMVTLLRPRKIEGTIIAIVTLLSNMKTCVDTYAKRLKVSKKSNIKGQTQRIVVSLDDGDDEGLALLIPDIQETFELVERATCDGQLLLVLNDDGMDEEMGLERPLEMKSLEQRYVEIMKQLQFDTYEMITETENGYRFVVSYNFERNTRVSADRGLPARVKRLAQETVTLSTSLPLSYSSSVFVRCDTDRLDVMKVLITGPAETPYANGCFEFDVFFPPDYPNSPMLINLETTGRHTVRFNPNLYNDGKVCLSVLNTWHGRPEEKWNPHTSSFLQVLVSIQSLILVPEPYFNEPGFERSRGTPSGTMSSLDYNSNIYQACVRWAMLEQIRNPNPVFKEVIHTHFWLKRHEICNQIESWIAELAKLHLTERVDRSMVLRRQYRQLREELAKLPIPTGLEDLDQPFSATVLNPNSVVAPDVPPAATSSNVTVTTTGSNDTSAQSSASTENDFMNMTTINSDSNLNDMENHGLG